MPEKCPPKYKHKILVCFKDKKRKDTIKNKINILLKKTKKKAPTKSKNNNNKK